MLKVSDIREFIRLLDETSLHELQIETESVTVTMKKSPVTTVAVQATADVPVSHAVAPPVIATQTAAPVAQDPVAAVPAEPEANTALVESPMVGTFYRAPSPTSGNYVEVGSKVTEKSVVCIVEAMKLMNEIEADVRGEIVEVLADNGQLVEYGQPLFRVKLS